MEEENSVVENVAIVEDSVAVNVEDSEVENVVSVEDSVAVVVMADLLTLQNVHLSKKLLIAVSVQSAEVVEVEIVELEEVIAANLKAITTRHHQEDVVEMVAATEEKDVSMIEWTLK